MTSSKPEHEEATKVEKRSSPSNQNAVEARTNTKLENQDIDDATEKVEAVLTSVSADNQELSDASEKGDVAPGFTIVINNILPAMFARLSPRGEDFHLIAHHLNAGKYKPTQVILNPFSDALDEMEDVVTRLPDEVVAGVEQADIIDLAPENVRDIDTTDFRAEVAALRDVLASERSQMAQLQQAT
ncbi:hypothetical protein P43SY_002152 [Pythium insidiosum]|uniref:Uncharacterized protein n=1 Tax=Pythium insidiosum TaxID=114742 RepID=A0AAD5LDQ9_PYTIN|nr:hypothetical protein P43SY_002152 [Pythium insidiosum]